MTDDRERILAAIRRSLRGTDKFDAARNPASPLTSMPQGDFESQFGKFKAELESLGGLAEALNSDADASEFIAEHTGPASSIFIYDEIASLHRSLVESLSESRHVRFGLEFPVGYDKRDAAAFDAAVTGCAACVAETGTVVIRTDMRLPAALAPKLFVVVDSGQLLASLDEFFTDSFGNTDASNLFLITGPSRTADIEKQLVKGVHGPKEIVVLFINQ